jgi:hypothetical protein
MSPKKNLTTVRLSTEALQQLRELRTQTGKNQTQLVEEAIALLHERRVTSFHLCIICHQYVEMRNWADHQATVHQAQTSA